MINLQKQIDALEKSHNLIENTLNNKIQDKESFNAT